MLADRRNPLIWGLDVVGRVRDAKPSHIPPNEGLHDAGLVWYDK